MCHDGSGIPMMPVQHLAQHCYAMFLTAWLPGCPIMPRPSHAGQLGKGGAGEAPGSGDRVSAALPGSLRVHIDCLMLCPGSMMLILTPADHKLSIASHRGLCS